MTDDPTVFAPPPAQYSHVNGPPLEIPAESLQALQALATDASQPGVGVTASDLVNAAIDDYLASQKKQLAKIAAQAEADELERVLALHGGEQA